MLESNQCDIHFDLIEYLCFADLTDHFLEKEDNGLEHLKGSDFEIGIQSKLMEFLEQEIEESKVTLRDTEELLR